MPRDPKKINSYIFFDFETGGLNHKKNPVMSFAALAVDGVNLNEIVRYETLVKPYGDLVCEPGALKVNGLTVEECRLKGITLTQLGADLKELAEEANLHKNRTGGKPIFVGHNAAEFDKNFLVDILVRSKTDLSKLVSGSFDYNDVFVPTIIDTIHLNKIMTAEITDHDTKFKLGDCCQRAGVELTDAHDAMNDVVATSDLFKYMAMRLRSGSSEVTVSAGKASVHRSSFEWR